MKIIRRYVLCTSLFVPFLLHLAGCAGRLPATIQDIGATCTMTSGDYPPQMASDDCSREICVAGHVMSSEDFSETAAVTDWALEKFCLFHPLDCFGALDVKNHVREWEQEKVREGLWSQASLQSGLGDAARHAYLACLLSGKFGGDFAKGLLDAHEEDSSVMFGFGTAKEGNRCCDKLMDLYNNRIGIQLASQPGACEEKVLKSLHRLRHSICVK
jgi:hypothetical protein